MVTRWLVGTAFAVLGASLAVAAPAWAGPEVSTRRLGGPDRYAAAAEVAGAYSNSYGGAAVARDDAFPDALTAVNLGGPALLTWTAVKVFGFAEQEFGWRLTHLNVARGDGFADALAGAPHAGEEEAPILLTVSPTQIGTGHH